MHKEKEKYTGKNLIKTDPLISIGMLVYNHEKYISDALEGLLIQTYTRMELIILDDASTDHTSDIIRSYMPRLNAKFERVKFIQNELNSGNIPFNCNKIEKQIHGDFYFGPSGDDILLPDCVSLLYKNLINHPEAVLIHANATIIDDDFHFGDIIPDASLTIHGKQMSGIESDMLFQRLMCGNLVAAPTVLLRAEVFEKYGYHDEDIAFEDYEYWIRLSISEKFYYLDRSVVLYRRSELSATNYCKGDTERKVHIAIESDYKTKKKYINKLTDDEKKKCWENYYKTYSLICGKIDSVKELNFLESFLKKESVDISKYRNITERMKWQNQADFILNQWRIHGKDITIAIEKYLRENHILSVAIYGYSHLGRVLAEELCKVDIHVKYIIDQKGYMLNTTLPVYTLNDILPSVDSIIVVPPGLIHEVYPLLKEKTSNPVFDFRELLMKIRD